ncbi:RNA-binding protein 43 isoform X2 [Alligator mississippiensis]|uniref:RNA-binding protein 43 isoform X2 n=1 Tax=Alligator mississippiensis TaxID=8496 RepID=UPI00287769C6|nr:RNA-binding protein 43 isoform X2 [Alligator mississippiensis]
MAKKSEGLQQAAGEASKSERTVIVSGIPDGVLKDEVMADILMIHFQRAKNRGGDVEGVVYPTTTKGVAYITFEDQKVTEKVLKKSEHQLEDKRLPRHYPLKVSLYSQDVFSCISCVLDLSGFGDKYVLEDLVQELQKNITALSFSPLQPNGQISVQGSFPSIQSLKDNLLLKANSLSKTDKKAKCMSSQRSNSKTQKHGVSVESKNNFIHNAVGEKQVVLDTDVYYYMKHILHEDSLAKKSVVSREVTDGEITILYLEKVNASSDPSKLEKAKKKIEDLSAELHSKLQKKRFHLDGSKHEMQMYQHACKRVQPQYSQVLVIPYETHIDVIGSSSDIFGFAQEVKTKVKHYLQKTPQEMIVR